MKHNRLVALSQQDKQQGKFIHVSQVPLESQEPGRRAVEEMHKSLKQNALLGKSPTKMERTQCNHIFATMLAFVKLERLKIKERLNHFALKAKLHLKMAKAAFEELRSWQTA